MDRTHQKSPDIELTRLGPNSPAITRHRTHQTSNSPEITRHRTHQKSPDTELTRHRVFVRGRGGWSEKRVTKLRSFDLEGDQPLNLPNKPRIQGSPVHLLRVPLRPSISTRFSTGFSKSVSDLPTRTSDLANRISSSDTKRKTSFYRTSILHSY